jgi:hypothetical protein
MWAIRRDDILHTAVVGTLSNKPLIFDSKEEAELYIHIHLINDPNYNKFVPVKCVVVSMK